MGGGDQGCRLWVIMSRGDDINLSVDFKNLCLDKSSAEA